MDTETNDAPKRGPGRPPKAETATVIYRPLDNGDPIRTETHGIGFEANIPKQLAHATHGALIELLRGNPWFSVDGKSHPRRKPVAEAVPRAGVDVNPDALDDKKMIEAD